MSNLAKKVSEMSDSAFDAFYEIMLVEKKKREGISSDSMPAPSAKVEALLSKLDFFYAYKLYAEENFCTITLAKMAIDKWRRKA